MAIKLPVGDVPAKACMAIKRMTGLSLAEIKRREAHDEFLFVCGHVDDDGLRLINRIRREMKKFGISVRQFEDGAERPPELLDNIERLQDEINAEYPGNRD